MARLDLAALEQLVRSLTAADATKTFDQVVDEACANQEVRQGEPQPVAVIRLHLKYILYFASEAAHPDLSRYEDHSKTN